MTRQVPALVALTRCVLWAHDLLGMVLSPGDVAFDLTAGRGHDTAFLWSCVAPSGCVVAFDSQAEAIAATSERCRNLTDLQVHSLPCRLPDSARGIHLVHGGHEYLAVSPLPSPRAIIANLGYLPGGDPRITSCLATTLKALAAASELLLPGGRLAVVAYPGHPEGEQEAAAVSDFFTKLEPRCWKVLHLSVPNRAAVPMVLVGEKSRDDNGKKLLD